ncbi:uncharacterized protein LOC120337392 [Styela clava]
MDNEDISSDDDFNIVTDLVKFRSKITKLKIENAKLKRKLAEFSRNEKNCNDSSKFIDASCQTDFIDIKSNFQELKKDSNSIVENLNTRATKKTTISASNISQWTYDHHRGLYFDYNTHLYYYPNTELFYNYKNGCYYKYNETSQQYEFQHQLEDFKNSKSEKISRNIDYRDSLCNAFSKVSLSNGSIPYIKKNDGVSMSSGPILYVQSVSASSGSISYTQSNTVTASTTATSCKVPLSNVRNNTRTSLSSGPISYKQSFTGTKTSSGPISYVQGGVSSSPISDGISNDTTGSSMPNTKGKNPSSGTKSYSRNRAELGSRPCIRAMVTASKSLKPGTIFMITYPGAILGSSENCDIRIPDEKVDKKHCAVMFDQEKRKYFVTDYGSNLGTTLNSITENNPGLTTVFASPVSHKSVLLIGDTVLVLHLHLGNATCPDCEPGLVQAIIEKSESVNSPEIVPKRNLEVKRRSELKFLKKKFNLHGEGNVVSTTDTSVKYIDRALERRLTKGSDNPYEKNEMPTSVYTELADNNKGFQMLQKMGWSRGQCLGKTCEGITEPITPQGNSKERYGLGFGKI